METTIKTSVSLQKPVWKLLKTATNKSRIVNEALEMYFDKQEFLQKADNQYWNNVQKSLTGKTGEYTSLNPNSKLLQEKHLEDKLWN